MLHPITLTSSAVLPSPIVEKTSDRQHPDAHIHGFTLRALYVHAPSQTIERHALRFDDHPHLIDPTSAHSRRLQTDIPAFSATTNSKERVIALLGLNAQTLHHWLLFGRAAANSLAEKAAARESEPVAVAPP